MTHWHDSLMCDMSHSYMENHSFMYLDRLNMGRQRFLGSLKMYVSFANEPYKNRGSLAKKTYILKEPTKRWHPIFFVKCYEVAMVCRLPKLSGLFCKKSPIKIGLFFKRDLTIHPTKCYHHIAGSMIVTSFLGKRKIWYQKRPIFYQKNPII